MIQFSRRVAAVVSGGVVLASVFAAAPAFAEGSWTSKLTGVAIGKSSRSWQDSHTDRVRTATTFAGCRISGKDSGFRSATVRLYDERGWLPDKSMGSKVNKCGRSDWGVMTRPDRYHWTISELNGSSYDPVLRLSVTTVRQAY
ncbi:hypothetical protein [Curtobacterium oceanosedimentum]|uniref:hypothetical protein n=1 Tax=Curtobacterium oceanosedimentum TaxID=465820 RepID=UPI001CE1E22C|nr:hypothetical protein [Curtobacterium oceanosedimentum]MCA5923924.1 hypothetical protein [Curtobacterium oceanosedimentum]